MTDHPALEAYNTKRASGWNLNVWDTVCLADAMRDEYEARIKALEKERDLAIAHDRQPYPTADAYERVCALLAAERGKRCGTCGSWHPLDSDGDPNTCCCGQEILAGHMDNEGHNPPADFGCTEWAEQGDTDE